MSRTEKFWFFKLVLRIARMRDSGMTYRDIDDELNIGVGSYKLMRTTEAKRIVAKYA